MTLPVTGLDQRETELRAARPDHHPIPDATAGTHTLWDDARQTYVLQWGQGAYGSEHGARLAGLADTLIMSVEAIRYDRHKLGEADFVSTALTDVRRLRSALAAVEDELLRASRGAGLSLRQTGTAMGLHHTTAEARINRLAAGERADWHGWLTQDSPAAQD